MSDNLLRQLFNAVLAADQPELPDTLCESIRDQLDLYVEADLAGTAAAQQYPHIAQHVQQCPACLEVYALLRATLVDLRENRTTYAPLDPQRYPPPFAVPQPTPAPSAVPLDWALQHVRQWLANLTFYQPQPAWAGATRRIAEPSAHTPTQPVFERLLGPILAPEAKVLIRAQRIDSSATVLLRIEPEQARPTSGQLILYRVHAGEPPTVELVATQTATASGRVKFENLPLDNYMLSLKRPQNAEVELVWLGNDIWSQL